MSWAYNTRSCDHGMQWLQRTVTEAAGDIRTQKDCKDKDRHTREREGRCSCQIVMTFLRIIVVKVVANI
ncbi:hypothetical protein R5R35_000097 [Gryllus longicercus]|uniref:Uncharacterized protein n=1 Tax=Gryllus longicercus TaxID=2509291 RepID=A0AAN9VFM2_9ORTH